MSKGGDINPSAGDLSLLLAEPNSDPAISDHTTDSEDVAGFGIPAITWPDRFQIEILDDAAACFNADRARLQGPDFCNREFMNAHGKACQKP